MPSFRLKLLSAVLLLAFAFPSGAQQAFTAEEAVAYALRNSAQVRNALLAVESQQQTNREITAAAFPQINGSVNYTDYINIPVTLLPGELAGQPGVYIPVKFGVKYNMNYGVELRQLLFEGQVFVGLQAKRTSMEFAEANLDVTREQIKANVLKVYYQILAGRQQASTLAANIARIESLLEDTREIYRNGFAEKLDVDKVEVTLTNLRTEKMRVDNQLAVALYGLKLLMGMPVKDSLILTDELPEERFRQDAADLVYKYSDRKEYRQIELQEKLNEFNIRRYKLTYIPTVSVSGNYSRNAFRNEWNFFKSGEPWFNTTFLSLSVNVPIFDGFARAARVKKARIELEQTRIARENLELAIDNEVQQARINLQSAVASMEYQKKNMALAEKVYEQTTLKYQEGLGSNLEITNAQAELSAAQNNYYAALYDAIIAQIDYQRAIGQL